MKLLEPLEVATPLVCFNGGVRSFGDRQVYFVVLRGSMHGRHQCVGAQAVVVRSHLDITHPLAAKDSALLEFARLPLKPAVETAVIDDEGSDIAMFERSGLSVAVGKASPEARCTARFVTDSNCGEGFANAVERFILHRRVLRPARDDMMSNAVFLLATNDVQASCVE